MLSHLNLCKQRLKITVFVQTGSVSYGTRVQNPMWPVGVTIHFSWAGRKANPMAGMETEWVGYQHMKARQTLPFIRNRIQIIIIFKLASYLLGCASLKLYVLVSSDLEFFKVILNMSFIVPLNLTAVIRLLKSLLDRLSSPSSV